MDNTIVNNTTMEQMPNGFNTPPLHDPEHEKHTKRNVFIAIAVLIVIFFLGYWYLNTPKDIPEINPQPSSETVSEVSNQEMMATAIASQNELESMYFDNVSDGL